MCENNDLAHAIVQGKRKKNNPIGGKFIQTTIKDPFLSINLVGNFYARRSKVNRRVEGQFFLETTMIDLERKKLFSKEVETTQYA